jgi:hypothetical protein
LDALAHGVAGGS